ncbi:hypothetical protein [Bradyrhizobium sp.]|uniref:hypothetical protein n=1 Tax=Bradyrhizobium sp. TaxID=376 RepID=UPI0025C0E222|nr:hypothetical protein [Bradyrhizobium sp.]
MATIRVDGFRDETIVLHFGGLPGRMDAYTLGEALIGFAETARAISSTVDPGQEIEIVVEAAGPGSYRTVIRRIRKDGPGLLTEGVKAIFWAIVATVIYDHTLKPSDPPPQIIITTAEVTIKVGHETVIVPRNVYNTSQNAKKNPVVEKGIRRMFRALEADKAVTDFGMTASLNDAKPTIQIPRADFPAFPKTAILESIDEANQRFRRERARLLVIKPWLNHAKRKWSFEWNGVPISAPISDAGFLDQIDRHEVLFGAGDALDVEITYKQTFSPELGIYENDNNSYVVSKVVAAVPRS